MERNLELLLLNIDNINRLLNNKIESLEKVIDKAVLKELGLKQAIVYNYDALISGEIEGLEFKLDNIMEARFFNETMELTIINEEILKGNIAIEKSNELVVEETYEIYHNNYCKLAVKKYLELDDDGQAYIKYLKPCKLYKKEQK